MCGYPRCFITDHPTGYSSLCASLICGIIMHLLTKNSLLPSFDAGCFPVLFPTGPFLSPCLIQPMSLPLDRCGQGLQAAPVLPRPVIRHVRITQPVFGHPCSQGPHAWLSFCFCFSFFAGWTLLITKRDRRPVRSALIFTRGSRIAEQKSRAKGPVTGAGYTDTRTRGQYMQGGSMRMQRYI